MSGGRDSVFLIRDGQLVELHRAPYVLEDDFQTQLAKHPQLLGGGQSTGGLPSGWLLIAREVPVPDRAEGSGRWSVDHLFIDQDAVPTFVEVKRGRDTRLRREVVGQMLDYAANGARYWPSGYLRRTWEESLPVEVDGVAKVESFSGLGADRFWADVEENLEGGHVRMLFVADEIPTELQTVIEYLNEQMGSAEVLGVSMTRYEGEGLSVLVPRVVGSTARLQQSKQGPTGKSYEEHIVDAGNLGAEIEKRLLDFAEAHSLLTRRTPKALQVLDASGERDVVQFYPGFGTVQLTLEPLRQRGYEEIAAQIHQEASLVAGRELTAKYPGIPLERALENWARIERALERMASLVPI